MKLIQLIGTRNKTDFTFYFSHVLTSLSKRVLVIDATSQEFYKNGYTHLEEGQSLYDFHNIDILCGAKNWMEVEELLRSENEKATNYDVILVDIDSTELLINEWPAFSERFYVGDDEKINQSRDVELLHFLFDETESTTMKRITFTSTYKLLDEYFDNLMNHRVTWRSINYLIEPDELEQSLRIQMQHEQMIPFKKLNKQYKDILFEIVSEIYQMHIKEINEAVKPSFFNFARKQKQPALIK
ncbi:hypothetical protein MKZ20_22070 [Psychrobacillus sp. FSL K6-2684]|uniref:hypothetical protein n=1 Tax=unclassified Psychrobacillus TaxID=2636677 RepID=UPI0030FC727E